MKVDLHIHSNISDGRLSPTEVVEFAHQNNLDIIALSDHDDVGGIDEAAQACQKYGIKLIPAIEFTCSTRGEIEKLPQDLQVHILGYNIDHQNTELVEMLATHRKRRIDKCKDIVKSLSEFGYNIEYDEIKLHARKRMRIADITNHLKENVENDENLNNCIKYLERDGFKDLRCYDFTMQNAIDIIHKFAGIAILAHPFISYTDNTTEYLSNEDLDILLDYLCNSGIDGIEADYLSFSHEQKALLNKIAAERNLTATIGSDFHGGVKRNAMISEECKNKKELEEKLWK
ncbi:MAG: PHP domain-containing protein [Chitinivibrionia bacterium]|nr:PHP domain-containing protein [Chitinivibrionia bacterium]